MKKYNIEICIAAVIIIITIATFIFLPKEKAIDFNDDKIWCKQVETFYQDAAKSIKKIAKDRNATVIKLLPEENNSNYLFSSPCNNGLVNFLIKASWNRTAVAEILYIDNPIYPNEITGRIVSWFGSLWSTFSDNNTSKRLTNNWQPKKGRAVWKRKKFDKKLNPSNSKESIDVNISIENISIDKVNNKFQATFAIFYDHKVLLKKDYKGDSAQINWFLRQNYSHIFLYVFAGLCFVWLILYLFGQNIPSVYGGCNPYPESAKLASGIVFVGLVSSFILIFCNPIQRQEARYSISTNVFFVIDRNSEIFFDHSHKDSEKVTPPYVVRKTYDNIKKSLTKPKAQKSISFFDWIADYSFESIYKKQMYMLNRERRYPVFTFSGLNEKGLLNVEKKSKDEMNLSTFVSGTDYEGNIRESRLFIPQYELQGFINDKKNNFVCLFTSACSACKSDVSEYINNVSKLINDKKNPNLFVFTVLLPTIPRTGSNHIYDFEDGKIALASLVSDKLVVLNDTKYNVNAILKLIGSEFFQKFKINYKTMEISPEYAGVYKIHTIGSDFTDTWDQPRDLMSIRNETLLLDRQSAESGSKLVADAFVKFVEDIDKKSQKKSHSTVHVLKNEPFGYWLILILCSLFGFSLFTRTRNDLYLFYVSEANNKLISRYDFAEPLITFGITLLGLFILQWRCIDPLLWAFAGDIDYAFISGLLFWFCLFCGPFLVLRIWQRINSLNYAKLLAFIISFIGLCLAMGFYFFFQPDWISKGLYFKSFLGTVCALLIPLLIFPVMFIWYKKRNINFPQQARWPWWRRPWWTLILKFIFIFYLLIMIRSAYYANPIYFFSYSTCVFVYLPMIFSIIGIALLLSGGKAWLPISFAGVTLGFIILILTLT